MAHESSTNTYLRTRVMTARPEELRLMLLDGAIKFARQGREGLAAHNREQTYAGLSQARDIVLELATSVRDEVDPDLCSKVKGLYMFIYTELANATLERDTGRADKAIELLEYERETWVLLMRKLGEERGAARTGPPPATPDEHASLSVQA